jgi:hypothetical protein
MYVYIYVCVDMRGGGGERRCVCMLVYNWKRGRGGVACTHKCMFIRGEVCSGVHGGGGIS